MNEDQEAQLRRKAVRRADAKLAFRSHLTTYVVVNAILFGINYLTSPGSWWFVWPLFGWGIALTVHAIGTYNFLSGGRERMIEEELKRLRERGG